MRPHARCRPRPRTRDRRRATRDAALGRLRPRPAALYWYRRREWSSASALLDPDPLDFPVQLDSRIRFNPLAHGFTQRFNIIPGGVTGIDEEIAVHFRDLRPAHAQAPAAGGVDQFPGAVAGGILEGRPSGLFANWLSRFAVGLHLVPPRANGLGVRDRAAKTRRGEDDRRVDAAVAVDELHVGIAKDMP